MPETFKVRSRHDGSVWTATRQEDETIRLMREGARPMIVDEEVLTLTFEEV